MDEPASEFEVSESSDSATTTLTLDIEGLVLEGCGSLGYAHMGAIQTLEAYGVDLDKINYWAGSSFGAIIAALIACGYSTKIIQRHMESLDLSKFFENSGTIRNAVKLAKDYGQNSGSLLESWIREMIGSMTGDADITLGDLKHKFGKTIVIVMSEVYENKCRAIYASYKTHADWPLVRCLKYSATMPIIFRAESVDCGDHTIYYVDGGVTDNYPIEALRRFAPRSDKVYGIKLMATEPDVAVYKPLTKFRPDLFLMSLISSLRDNANDRHLTEEDWDRTIKVKIGKYRPHHHKLSSDDRDNLIRAGCSAVLDYLT